MTILVFPYIIFNLKKKINFILKFFQYIFKFLASIFSKLGAQYSYTKLIRYLMRYKLISILWKPLKYVLSNLIYFIKLAGAIMAILSLFNISLLYYNFDILTEVNDIIN
jgi:hypothetical protein